MKYRITNHSNVSVEIVNVTDFEIKDDGDLWLWNESGEAVAVFSPGSWSSLVDLAYVSDYFVLDSRLDNE